VRTTIDIKGLREFQRALKQMDADLPKQIRVAFNSAAAIVVDWAQPRIPRRSGAAAASLKARSGQREARIAAGGRRAPYYPWLDFGGRVGRNKSVERKFYTEGRYIYVGVREQRKEIVESMSTSLTALARTAGLEVD
jgi:hypothetical protein